MHSDFHLRPLLFFSRLAFPHSQYQFHAFLLNGRRWQLKIHRTWLSAQERHPFPCRSLAHRWRSSGMPRYGMKCRVNAWARLFPVRRGPNYQTKAVLPLPHNDITAPGRNIDLAGNQHIAIFRLFHKEGAVLVHPLGKRLEKTSRHVLHHDNWRDQGRHVFQKRINGHSFTP